MRFTQCLGYLQIMNTIANDPDHTRALYRTIFENTGTATILIEEDMTISLVNSELTRISGIPKDQVEMKMKFPELIDEPDREMVINNHYLRRRHPNRAPRNYPCRVKVADGQIKECLLTVALVKGTGQSVASITDLTLQKRLERQVARISEEERRDMGQILHDDMGSHLAGVEAMSALLAGRLSKAGHPDAGLALEIQGLINDAIRKTKVLVRGLLPADLEKTGFTQALDRYLGTVQKAFGSHCAVTGALPDTVLSLASRTHLYYIVREAVNNAARHGKAEKIDIRITRQDDDLVVDILDDGSGWSSANVHPTGMGQAIMQQRAGLIRAELTISTQQQGGTRVRCRINNIFAS